MVGDELVLRGGEVNGENLKIAIKDGLGRVLFYVIKKEDGSMAILVGENEVAVKSDIVIPPVPTTDGHYALDLVVDDGEATYSWVEVTG